MSFCKPSSELILKNETAVENAFFVDYLPSLNPTACKVYLYGLYLCQNGIDNTIEHFERVFNLSEDDVISIFKNLEELNLVQCLELVPMEVRYLPLNNASVHLKKFNKDKYKKFNATAQTIISKRMIDVKEYENYYYLIEFKNMEQEALLKVIEYCVYKKGADISSNYIIKVAKDWAYEGLLTSEQVENRINELERYNEDLKLILSSLGFKRNATMEEYQMFLDWKNNLEFSLETLTHLAKLTKKKKGNFIKLNALVNKCYELKKFSPKEIDDYFSKEEEYYNSAKSVCKNLGLRYDNLSIVVETYIAPWTELGFDESSLLTLSNYCFKCGIKSLEGLNTKVQQFFKLGLITTTAINTYLEELTLFDNKIQNILDEFGLARVVNKFDRSYYNTWINEWNINDEVLSYAIAQSKNKIQPMQFLNRVLSIYFNKGIKTVDQAKAEKLDFESTYTKESKKPKSTKYSKEEINSLFDNVNEVELW